MNGKTFFKLLKTPVGHYFYDANTNQIIGIDEHLFSSLKKYVDTPESLTLEERASIDELHQKGYLRECRVKKVENILTDYLDDILDRQMQMLTLQVTQNCNFRCKYCLYTNHENGMQREHSAKSMSLETAKRAIDFFAKHSIDSETVNIGMYGGEPLMEFQLIKEIVAYSELVFRNKELKFNMTTNASLLTDEIVDFLQEHNFSILISLDGPEKINDTNRVFANGTGTFSTVIRRLRSIKERYPDFFPKLAINMVIDPRNSFDEINSITSIPDMIPKERFQTNFVDTEFSGDEIQSTPEFIAAHEYSDFLAYLAMIDRFPYGKIPVISQRIPETLSDDIVDLDLYNGLSEVTAPGGPCIPGQMRFFVNVDGDFYPCERVNEISPATYLGNLDQGILLEQAKAMLNVASTTKEECQSCWAFSHCTSCIKNADTGKGISREKRLSYCDNIRSNTERKLRQIILINELKSTSCQKG